MLAAGEKFELDLAVGEAVVAQRGSDRQHHRFGTADEGGIHRTRIEPVREQRLHLRGVDAAGEQVDLLPFLFQHVDDRQPAEVEVLQILQLLAEHDRADLAIGIDEGELRLRLTRQHGLDDRQQRRDARAAGKAQILLVGLGLDRGEELAHRRHRVDLVAGGEVLVRPGREGAAIDALDADLQHPLAHARADRVAAAQFLAVEVAAQRQILSLGEIEQGAVLVLGGEGDDHGVAGFAAHIGHGQRMEACHAGSFLCSGILRCT
ncbi:hypothetical protein SDC9_25612 [bioreactor metagenome]|uniref:Uncharacterized protein n=1 Tax=bioreactor metagenome TaxID=1076179 RepID=A0A644UL26_9ZZZZ